MTANNRRPAGKPVARPGFSLMEVIAAVCIATAVMVATVPYLVQPADMTKRCTCELNQSRLNLEIILWEMTHNQWPNDLTQVTDDLTRFPEGPLMCPIFNTAYQLDSSGTSVVPHSHE